MKGRLIILALILQVAGRIAAEPLPIDSLWQSEAFRKAFVGAYGIDSRIEPLVNEDESFYLNEAAQAMAEGDRERAIGILDDSGLAAESPALLFSLGNFYFEEGRTEEAIASFTEALELFPNFRDAHRNLAILLIQTDAFEEAEVHLRRAIALGSQEGLTFGLLAYCHSLKNRAQAALAAYRMAQVTMPDEVNWRWGEAQMLQLLGQPEQAASIYGELLEENPSDVRLWINLSRAHARMEDLDSAIAHLELASRMRPLSPTNLLALGQMYLRKGLPGLALRHTLEAVESGKLPAEEAAVVTGQFVDLRHFEEGRSLVQACRAVFGEELETEENRPWKSLLERSLALAELQEGDREKGSRIVEALLETDPMDGPALVLLARFRAESGKIEEAIHLLEQAQGIDSVRREALIEHAKLLAGQARYEEALDLLTEANQLEPSDRIRAYMDSIRELRR